jgi:hypothetical protein
MLLWGVLGYSLLTGFTGLAQNFLQFSTVATVTKFPVTAGNFPSTMMATEAAPRSGRALVSELPEAGVSLPWLGGPQVQGARHALDDALQDRRARRSQRLAALPAPDRLWSCL